MPTIKELRNNNKLDEAYQIITEYLDYDPSFHPALNDFGWVLYDYLKQDLSSNNNRQFVKHLTEIIDWKLLVGQDMLTENVCWQIIIFFFKQAKFDNKDYRAINEVIKILKKITYKQPSEIHSIILKSIIKLELENLWNIISWWDLSKFRKEDYNKETIEIKGKQRKIPALAERTYIAISKQLLQNPDFGKIDIFLQQLEDVIEEREDYIYLQYYKAKFLILTNNENSLEAFLPFARKKQNNFWVWQVLAEIHKKEKDLQIACYCRALLCKSPSEFLIKIRQKLAKLLIDKSFFMEAKTEIKQIIEVRKEHDYKIPFEVEEWTKNEWYNSVENNKTNNDFYDKHKSIAENILLEGVEIVNSIVEFKNAQKTVFLIDKNNTISVKDRNKYKIGDFVKLWIDNKNILKHKLTQEEPTNKIVKEVSGVISIRNNQNFGFVDNVFVPDYLTKNFENGDKVNLVAIINFNKNKNEWGWKALKMNKKQT